MMIKFEREIKERKKWKERREKRAGIFEGISTWSRPHIECLPVHRDNATFALEKVVREARIAMYECARGLATFLYERCEVVCAELAGLVQLFVVYEGGEVDHGVCHGGLLRLLYLEVRKEKEDTRKRGCRIIPNSCLAQ